MASSSQTEEQDLIGHCLNGSLRHQRQLYDRYAARMMGLCMRYASSEEEAEDILQDGFLNVFRKLETFTGAGPLGAWVRKVILSAALMHYRKHKKHLLQVDLDGLEYMLDSGEDIISQISAKELMQMIQQLPTGYRIVFNLYAIEGYTHPEIAAQLEVSVGTSKSQYSRARALLRQMIEKEQYSIGGRIR